MGLDLRVGPFEQCYKKNCTILAEVGFPKDLAVLKRWKDFFISNIINKQEKCSCKQTNKQTMDATYNGIGWDGSPGGVRYRVC